MTDLHRLTIAEAGGLFRAKKLSLVEYAQALLDRAAAVNPSSIPSSRCRRHVIGKAFDEA
jgi:Asp-tRNA(Asn)/Glu-tRNA(Gln) amidotransferase A subunit family amidase